MKFGDDWTGVFVRGDNAIYYALALESLFEEMKGSAPSAALYFMNVLENLRDLLMSSNEHSGPKEERQVLLPFDQCQPKV